MQRRARLAVVLSCSAALIACTTLRPVDLPGAPTTNDTAGADRPLSPADAVVITKTDGSQLSLKLTGVTGSEIVGIAEGTQQAQSVPLAEIRKVDRRETAVFKTTLLVLGITLLVVMVEMAGAMGSFLAGP